jgi:hypothetical protein
MEIKRIRVRIKLNLVSKLQVSFHLGSKKKEDKVFQEKKISMPRSSNEKDQ